MMRLGLLVKLFPTTEALLECAFTALRIGERLPVIISAIKYACSIVATMASMNRCMTLCCSGSALLSSEEI